MSGLRGNEYRWTAGLFLISGVIAGIIFALRTVPIHRTNLALNERLQELYQELAPYLSRDALDPLADQARRQTATGHRLEQEWLRLMKLRDTFHGTPPFEQMLLSPEEGRIDFKVALYNARNMLMAKTQEQNISIPPGLGMEEAIGTDEPAEIRLWQLASIVRLVELCVELGIPRIEQIRPLPPVVHPEPMPDGETLREFPINLVFSGTFKNLLDFLTGTQREEQYFALQRFRVESLSTANPLRLRVEVICSAGLLRKDLYPRSDELESEIISDTLEMHEVFIPDSIGQPEDMLP